MPTTREVAGIRMGLVAPTEELRGLGGTSSEQMILTVFTKWS
jgi:hypothetical protein